MVYYGQIKHLVAATIVLKGLGVLLFIFGISLGAKQVPIRPLCPNSLVVNSQGKPFKVLVKEGLLETPMVPKKEHEKREEKDDRVSDERKIDLEIEEIQKEISWLSLRLEVLRLEKAKRNAMKTVERHGKIVQAKFMEPKQSVKNLDLMKKIEEPLPSSVKSKTRKICCWVCVVFLVEVMDSMEPTQLDVATARPNMRPPHPLQDSNVGVKVLLLTA
nr:hypothetical protein CFP56_45831 [Quercus suber]